MNHGSLFSGIGGFDLAAQWMDWNNIFQVEWDDYCQKVLSKNFPNVKRYGDIREFDGSQFSGTVDILSGGFPCQPFSHAGKRKGTEDDRYLWPEYLRVIREVQPSYVVGENVAGLVSMDDGETLERIFADLEGEAYTVESFIIPACAVGAWHRRDRIWIVAYCDKNEYTELRKSRQRIDSQKLLGSDVRRLWNKEFESELRRNANGVPPKLDKNRWEGLGNAIVPQVAYEIFKAIEKI